MSHSFSILDQSFLIFPPHISLLSRPTSDGFSIRTKNRDLLRSDCGGNFLSQPTAKKNPLLNSQKGYYYGAPPIVFPLRRNFLPHWCSVLFFYFPWSASPTLSGSEIWVVRWKRVQIQIFPLIIQISVQNEIVRWFKKKYIFCLFQK
jgi:hypothetical protein